ncbi:hypothetical protein H4R34_000757 [Dimargaris verticillata]|uniref:Nucleoside phosphorylase domain-containing protein n=1 Tax=Dimargaris verticillata TaxID=2761393 RepID=A0A9W8BB66_9FUNG|nr:hypothetical protein H4R34_000757 [Dimargaris verticillata]
MITANFPVDPDGRTHHVGLKRGEVANRIVTVGDKARAHTLALLLDQDTAGRARFVHESPRGFYTVTGTYQGIPVSIVAIGMGMAMMDFFVREVRAVVEGPMVIIRLGSCGTSGRAQLGDIIVPDQAIAVTRNYDYFLTGHGEAYHLTKPVACDVQLGQAVRAARVKQGLNATCDSFYSSQGRQNHDFVDANRGIIDQLKRTYPQFISMEMETFMLYHLASVSAMPDGDTVNILARAPQPSVRAAAAMMVFADRAGDQFIDRAVAQQLETAVGQAVLGSLVANVTDTA